MTKLLEIIDLHVDFKVREEIVHALQGVNLQIDQGEVVGLVGESGCGKSQSARAIIRLLAPNGCISSGRIIWQGKELTTISDKAMQAIRGKEIALIFQDPKSALHPVLTIEKQMCESLRYHQGLSKQEAKVRCYEILKAVKIADVKQVMKSYPFQLSIGMCQRIMIAMAIISDATLWIADEVTSSLDVSVQADILDLLKTIQQEKGIAMLFITHDLRLLPSMCNRIAVMLEGKIVEELNSADLFRDGNHHPYTEKLRQCVKETNR